MPDPDMETYAYPHTMLISLCSAAPSSASTVLHYWDVESTERTSPTPQILIHTQLTLDNLRSIHGFQQLGTFTLPVSTTSGSAGISQFLMSLVTDGDGYESQFLAASPNSSDEIITRILAQLRKLQSATAQETVSFQLVTIPVFSNTAKVLSAGESIPLWKWAKPTSLYGLKSGWWQREIDRAIEDGERNAGKDLQLIVRAVSEEKWEELMDRNLVNF